MHCTNLPPPPQFTAKRLVSPCRLAALLLIFTFGVFAVPTSHAQTTQTVSANWGLIPSGINIGGSFRLLFVTNDTRDAASSDINDYNTFVQAQAAAATGSGAPITTFSAEFRSLISTAAVDARDNTATNRVKASPDPDAPIYWLNGARVANNYGDFYDGDWDSIAARNQNGDTVSARNVWTGSNNDGTENVSGSNSRAAGNNIVRVGNYSRGGTSVISDGSLGKTTSLSLYALSPVLTVGDVLSFKVKVFLEGAQ